MSKAYTEADFLAQVTGDRNWRIKEISDLKAAVKSADSSLQRVLLRALVTICYAHWEGYVRFSARKFFEHVAIRKLQYSALDRQFLRNYFLPRLNSLSASRLSIADRCVLIDDILNAHGRRFSHANDELVNTKSNLNSSVLLDLCTVCGISSLHFFDKFTFIDAILLKRRNEIAHGEETFVELADLDEITTDTIALMRTFGDLLENNVVQEAYRAG
jgi:hypothetical protein